MEVEGLGRMTIISNWYNFRTRGGGDGLTFQKTCNTIRQEKQLGNVEPSNIEAFQQAMLRVQC